MAIALAGTATSSENASGTSVTLTVPTGAAVGEILVAAVTHSSSASLSAPVGFTLIFSQSQATAQTTAMFYRVVTGTEAASYTFNTSATAGRVSGWMSRVSGVDTSNPLDASAVGSTQGATTFTFTTPSFTTVTNGAFVLYDLTLNAATANDFSTTVSPSGPVQVFDTTGTGRRMSLFTETYATAGTVPSHTWTMTGTNPVQTATVSVALRPTTAAASPVTASPTSVASGTAFGTLTASTVITSSPSSVASGVVVPSPALTAVISISPTSIASGVAFGLPSANGAPATLVSPTSITLGEFPSDEDFPGGFSPGEVVFAGPTITLGPGPTVAVPDSIGTGVSIPAVHVLGQRRANIFLPPRVKRRIPLSGGLIAEYLFGQALLRIDGEWVLTEFPTQQQLDAADLYFDGGRLHDVDDDTAAVLTAAGYELSTEFV